MGVCATMAPVPEVPPTPEKNEPTHRQPKTGWGCLIFHLLVIYLVVPLPLPSGWSYSPAQEKARQNQAVNNCRQVVIALHSYAIEYGSSYPNGATANDAFRQMFKAGVVNDERIFGAPASPYVGDNNLGEAPEYARALEFGENHWAMTKGLGLTTNGAVPLVFENPARASWPPRWDGRLVGVALPGRIWKNDKVVVGRNDGSVHAEKLARGDNPLLTLEPIKDGKNLFDLAGRHEILDVAK